MLGITEEETKAQAEKSCIMTDKNERACYVAGYLGGYEAAETERQEYEKKLLQSNLDQLNKIVLLSQKVNDLQKAYDKQKEINKEQVDELEKWKAEWNTQVLVANEEAWERTKLTGELKRLREDYEKTQALLDKQIEATLKLDMKNAELKEKLKTAYRKGMRHMAKALKDYDRTDGAWTDYFEHTVDKVLQREQLDFEEYGTLADQPQEHTNLWNELCEQAEQFLKDSEVEK